MTTSTLRGMAAAMAYMTGQMEEAEYAAIQAIEEAEREASRPLPTADMDGYFRETFDEYVTGRVDAETSDAAIDEMVAATAQELLDAGVVDLLNEEFLARRIRWHRDRLAQGGDGYEYVNGRLVNCDLVWRDGKCIRYPHPRAA